MARKNCVTVANLSEVLCWVFRDDNKGPPMDIDEVYGNYETAQAQFPGAEVKKKKKRKMCVGGKCFFFFLVS